MSNSGEKEFIGVFPIGTEQKIPYGFRAIRDLFESAPSFRQIAMTGMKMGSERIHQAIPFVGRPATGGDVSVFERRVDNTSHHVATVALAANSLSDLIGLDENERDLFVTAAGLHDASKVLEIELMGYRELAQRTDMEGSEHTTILAEARAVIQTTFEKAGLDKVDTILNKIAGLTAQQFTEYFDAHINPVFLQNVLARTHLFPEKERRESLLTIASADSVGQIPALIARAIYFGEQYHLLDDPTFQDLLPIAKHLKERAALPEVKGDERTHFLALSLLMCDGIAQGDKIRTIDDRMDAAIRGGQYAALDEEAINLYGVRFFTANRIAFHAVERVLTCVAEHQALLPSGTDPKELPQLIFKNILRRADARLAP